MKVKLNRLMSDRGRLSFTEQFIKAADFAEAEGNQLLIPRSLTNQVRSAREAFDANSTLLQTAFATRMEHTAACKAKLNALKRVMRHFWSSLKHRSEREGTNEWGVKMFKLHVSKNIPALSTRADWITAAKELLKGEAQILIAGGPPMTNPSGEDLTLALTEAEAALAQLTQTRTTLNQIRQGLNGNRAAIDTLHVEIARYFRYILGPQPAANRRDQMRNYGYIFTTEGTAEADASEGSDEGTGETGDESTNPAGEGEQTPEPADQPTT